MSSSSKDHIDEYDSKFAALEQRISYLESHAGQPIQGEEQASPFEGLQSDLERSGLHGIPIIRNCRKVEQPFWILLLFVFFILALLHTIGTVRSAVQYPTHFRITYRRTYELPFHDFTLCSHYGAFMNITRLFHNSNDLLLSNDTIGERKDMDMEEWLTLLSLLPDIGYTSAQTMLIAKKLRSKLVNGGSSMLPNVDTSNGLKRLRSKFGGNIPAAMDHAILEYMIPCGIVFPKCLVGADIIDCCQLFRPIFSIPYGMCFATDFASLGGSGGSVFERNNHLAFIHIGQWSDPEPGREHFAGLDNFGAMSVQLGIEPGFSAQYVIHTKSRSGFSLNVQRFTEIYRHDKCLRETETELQLFRQYTVNRCDLEQCLLRYNTDLHCHWLMLSILNGNRSMIKTERTVPICNITSNDLSGGIIKIASEPPPWPGYKNCLTPCDRSEVTIADWMIYPGTMESNTVIQMRYANPSYPAFEEVRTLQWTDYLSMVGGLWGLWLGSSIITIIHIVTTAFRRSIQLVEEKVRVKSVVC